MGDLAPFEAEVDAPLRQLAERLRSIDTVHAHPAPPDLQATLRPYQERGVAWLRMMASLGLGATGLTGFCHSTASAAPDAFV